MKIAVIGVGLMGSQIGGEFALAGHPVCFVSRDPQSATARVETVLADAITWGVASAECVDAARAAIEVVREPPRDFDLGVECLPEDLELKVAELTRLHEIRPSAILVSSTSSLPISILGSRAGCPQVVVGVHYWNPPMLMPMVELVQGSETDPDVLDTVRRLLVDAGKQPIDVARDVPGFVWNRLQFAILREAIWLVENGVAGPEIIDSVIRDGLARRWQHAGLFGTIALGNPGTWQQVGDQLLPHLSNATSVRGLAAMVPRDPADLAELRRARDAGLAAALRGATPSG